MFKRAGLMDPKRASEDLERKAQGLAKAKRDALFDEFITPFDKLFDDFFRTSYPDYPSKYGINFFEKGAYPKADIRNTDNAIIIEAAIPGMKKEDVYVDICDGVITVSGKKVEDTNVDSEYIHRELKRSIFRRSWSLADYLDQENISAKFENGMLYLIIPKLQPEEIKHAARQIEIK